MSERVKYRSALRAERARETRRLIREAARDAFVSRGYGATTIAEIAAIAGVAEQTVYAVFGSKRSILEELVRIGVRGEGAHTELAQTEAWQAMLAAPDAAAVLERFASLCAEIFSRVSDVLDVVRSARGSDPVLRELAQRQDRTRRRDLALVVERLEVLGALRPGLAPAVAGDVLWTIASPEVYRMLVVVRSWSRRRYRDWLAETLRMSLLR